LLTLNSTTSVLVLIVIALAPGVVSWWQGRELRKRLDDPTLPERLHAARVRRGTVFGASLVLLGIASIDALVWSLPLMVGSALVAAYPLRRALFGETWSLATYVWFSIRLGFSVWGFWLLLPAAPFITSAAGSWDWMAALALAIVLLVFNARYAECLRFILRTRPIDDPVLTSRFKALVEKGGIPMPRFECVPLHGGVIANALALPSLRQSSVLFSETLLERLDHDQIVAICAHELAHLEHFNAAFMRRLNIENIALIVSGAFVAPFGRLTGLDEFLLPLLVWLLAVVGVLVRRAKDRQRNETASDLRAVALCGDGEALVSGLTRLYTMGRHPRRYDQQHEQQATHPSLARRIRDIRRAAGTDTASLGTAATFAGSDGRTIVTFDRESLSWSEGEAATHTLKYAYLAELRVQVRGSRPPSLVAVERGGRRWEMPLAQDDLVRAQSVLDVVDGQLPEPVPPPTAIVWPKVVRAFLLMGAMIGLASGQLAMALVAFLAMVKPAAPLMAAAGIASLATAAVILRQGFYGMPFTELALMLGGLGIVLLVVARTRRDDDASQRARLAVAVLGIFAALAVLSFLVGGIDPIDLHQSAQSITGAPILLLAFAGALTLWRSKASKYAAIPVIVVAAATTGVASTSFLDRFGDDLFISPAEPFRSIEAKGPVVTEFTMPFSGGSFQLSPRGRLLAVVEAAYDSDSQRRMRFHVGRTGRNLASVEADDLLFVDEERVLMAKSNVDGVALVEASAETPELAIWRLQLPDLYDPQLSLDAVTGAWRILGWNAQRNVVAVSGSLRSVDARRQEWKSAGEDDTVKSVAAADESVLLVEPRYKPGLLQRCGLWRLSFLFPSPPETVFRFASASQDLNVLSSRLDATCFAGALNGQSLACSAFDGTRTRFISLDPGSQQVSRLGWIEGRYTSAARPSNGWLSGWRNTTPVALHLQRRIAVHVDSSGGFQAFALAGADDLIGVMSYNGRSSKIRLIRLSSIESTSARAVE
jgi:heat shock protein HtpX